MSEGNRKEEESRFHDLLRSEALREDPRRFSRLTANRKYYAVVRKSRAYFEQWVIRHATGRRVLDYGCGDGHYAILAAHHGAVAVGVDISEVSVENARREALRQGVAHRASFHVMDAESLELPDNSFDIVCESGVLHHLDLDVAMREVARVLRPEGRAICAEALAHNPVFQLYRRMTPHLRTRWEVEHILRHRDVMRFRQLFDHVEMHFFHLVSLVAVPFRGSRVFPSILSALERVDDLVLKLPGMRWWAWQLVCVLSGPRKVRAPYPTHWKPAQHGSIGVSSEIARGDPNA